MKQKYSFPILAAIFFIACLVSVYSQDQGTQSDMINGDYFDAPNVELSYGTAAQLKEAYSDFRNQWSDFRIGEKRFIFCLVTLPSYGSSRHVLHGWKLHRQNGRWRIFATFHFEDLGAGKLVYDELDRLFQVVGTANNRFKDVTVFAVDLR